MPEFVIEKSIPGLGQMTPFQRDLSVRRSCSTLHGVAPDVAWVHSYLSDDKCYCVFCAPSEQVLRDLISEWGLAPPLSISQVYQVAGPDTKVEYESEVSQAGSGPGSDHKPVSS